MTALDDLQSAAGAAKDGLELGYDVIKHREEAADDVIWQMRAQLPTAPAVSTGGTEYGRTYTADFTVDGPNGGRGTLVTHWIIRHGEDAPRRHRTRRHRGSDHRSVDLAAARLSRWFDIEPEGVDVVTVGPEKLEAVGH